MLYCILFYNDPFCVIGGEELQALRGFLDKVEQAQLQTGAISLPKVKSGNRELFQDSGLYLSSTRLAAIHGEARKDCLRLFHLLFEEFFTPEECQNAVAFGKHGKVPDGKTVLNREKVKGILSKYSPHFVSFLSVHSSHKIVIFIFFLSVVSLIIPQYTHIRKF